MTGIVNSLIVKVHVYVDHTEHQTLSLARLHIAYGGQTSNGRWHLSSVTIAYAM